MRVPEEPVCSDLFRKNPVITSLHLKSPVHVVPPQVFIRHPAPLDVGRGWSFSQNLAIFDSKYSFFNIVSRQDKSFKKHPYSLGALFYYSIYKDAVLRIRIRDPGSGAF
jgi:hypothetical protein